jgi:hypothetical protein
MNTRKLGYKDLSLPTFISIKLKLLHRFHWFKGYVKANVKLKLPLCYRVGLSRFKSNSQIVNYGTYISTTKIISLWITPAELKEQFSINIFQNRHNINTEIVNQEQKKQGIKLQEKKTGQFQHELICRPIFASNVDNLQ